jgi:hypothetical protein
MTITMTVDADRRERRGRIIVPYPRTEVSCIDRMGKAKGKRVTAVKPNSKTKGIEDKTARLGKRAGAQGEL